MKISIPVIFNLFLSLSLLSQTDTISFDPLLLNEVVITDLGPDRKMRTPLSLSSIANPADLQIQGVAATLAQVPGIFSDASVGEVFSRVHTRGISLSAEDDIGWYYMSLQEDGLPITAVQYNQFSPDFFFRPDVSHIRMEVVKGGKSSILSPSGPAGIVNFISDKAASRYRTHDRITVGIYESGRPFLRLEGFSGSRIGKSTWSYDFAYMYRHDRGPREIDYALNNGGQIKLGINKNLKKGLISFKFKWLDDQVNRYTGVAAKNWNNPEPAFGQSFQNTSLLPPSFDGQLIDPRDPSLNSTINYDPKNGIKAKELSATVSLDLQLGDWRLTNKMKYSAKSLNWQTVIGGQPLGLENFITYFISGDPFPIGNVQFSNVESGQRLASVNNQGAFGVFQGLPPSFEYIDGQLPNDAILGTGTWFKDDHIDEFMNQLLLQRSSENIDLNLGFFASSSKVNIFTDASFLFATYEPRPQLLSVNLEGPDGSIRPLSDQNGLSNQGGLFYEAAQITAGQLGIFADSKFLLTEDLILDAGLRYERISHSGTKDRSAPSSNSGTLIKSAEDNLDFNYNYLNYSTALEYGGIENISIFSRYSLGHKATELNYYINNFTNQAIPLEPPPIQSIRQFELGIKNISKFSSFTATAFISNLSNVAYSNFVFDDQLNQIFYTPTQFNSSSTKGLELEWGALLFNNLTFNSSATFQKSNLNSFTLYNANGTIETSDDEEVNFSDNRLPHSPSVMASAGLTYELKEWHIAGRTNFIGSRYGNLENSFQLPSYMTLDTDFGYSISSKFAIGVRIKNILNSGGLANFFGPNSFGSNSDAATEEFINMNPNESFVVFPIMPRAIYLSLDYNFAL